MMFYKLDYMKINIYNGLTQCGGCGHLNIIQGDLCNKSTHRFWFIQCGVCRLEVLQVDLYNKYIIGYEPMR
jgi:hypothetical protein